jgi:hypothetical protein
MIHVKRDPALIPDKLLKVAARAQQKLETLPADERREFIQKKRHIWGRFKRYLRAMSHGKCWYSESSDPQSFFDVDHFRPKLRARRSDSHVDAGYEWLAFSWENFRYSAQRSNQQNKDEDTDQVVGKGDWFPLLDPSPCARWDDRCEESERPVLLDPVRQEDVDLVDVLDDGRMSPNPFCVGSSKHRVTRSIELYGLNLPALTAARAKVMRDVIDLHAALLETAQSVTNAPDAIADGVPLNRQMKMLIGKVQKTSAYSKAARAQLSKLAGGAHLLEQADRSPTISGR